MADLAAEVTRASAPAAPALLLVPLLAAAPVQASPPRPRSLELLAHELRWLQDISADLARAL